MANCCFIRQEGKYLRVPLSQICFVEAHKNYPRIYLSKGSFVALVTLKKLECQLPKELFCRIHRSYIVSLEHIIAFDAHRIYLSDRTLPLARHYQKAFHQKLLILNGEQTSLKSAAALSTSVTSHIGGLN